MARGLEGKQVVVTGGTGALGTAVVEAFVAAGATCHVPQRGAVATPPAPPGAQITVGIDLTDEDAVRRYYEACPPLWASVHLAGGFAAGPVLDTTLAELRRQLDLNLTTAFLACREAGRKMRRAGDGGRIVNVVSRAALVPSAGTSAYSASKAAVAMLTATLAAELLADRIWVNAVAPSIIDTAANRDAMPKANHAAWPQASEIAATIVWLASPDNHLTSGAIVPVYGRA